MKLVIEMSEDDYRKVQDGRASVSMMRKAIANGTQLNEKTSFKKMLYDALTIIETDKGE
jgi:hypothetical protein